MVSSLDIPQSRREGPDSASHAELAASRLLEDSNAFAPRASLAFATSLEKPPTAADPARSDQTAPARERVVTKNDDGSQDIRNTDGSTAFIDKAGLLRRVTRTDGSTLQCKYWGQTLGLYTETRDGKAVEWNQDDQNTNRWRTMEYPGAQRINLTIRDNGKLSYEDVRGVKYTVNGDMTQVRTYLDGTEVKLDAAGKVTSVTRADKSTITCDYDKSNKLTKVIEARGGTTTTWERDATADKWTAKGIDEIRYHYNVADTGNSTYVTSNKDNVIHIEYQDGTKRDFEYDNGQLSVVKEQTTYGGTQTWTRQGNTDTWKSGQNTETRTDVQVSLDGDYTYLDAKGFKHSFRFDHTEDKILPTSLTRSKETAQARDNLLKEAGKAITDKKELENFTTDIDLFERRCHNMQVDGKRVAETLKEVQQLLSSSVQNPTIDGAQRVKLAEQVMHHVAIPRSIDQGFHSTCGAATNEVLIASKYPDRLANLVRSVADTGTYTTTTGNVIRPAANSLEADFEARKYDPYSGTARGDRSFASQIFQVVGINATYQAFGWAMRYEQHRPTDPKDTGERVVNTWNNTVSQFNGMDTSLIRELGRQVAGQSSTVLQRGTNFNSEAEFKNQILQLQRNDQLPCIVVIHTKNEPFWSDGGSGRSGRPPGSHVATIWDIDANGNVLMDNQWGARNDRESLRRLPVSKLYGATSP